MGDKAADQAEADIDDAILDVAAVTHVPALPRAVTELPPEVLGAVARTRRVPPGLGALTEAELLVWKQKHPRAGTVVGSRQNKKLPPFHNPTPEWFWRRGYYYAGRRRAGLDKAFVETWLNDKGAGEIFSLVDNPWDIDGDARPQEHAPIVPPAELAARRRDEQDALAALAIWKDEYVREGRALFDRGAEINALPHGDRELEQELREAIVEFKETYGWVLSEEVPHLMADIRSEHGMTEAAGYLDVLETFWTFDPEDAWDAAPAGVDVDDLPPPEGLDDHEPIDLSGESE